jgi:hypothetical protein
MKGKRKTEGKIIWRRKVATGESEAMKQKRLKMKEN